MNSVRLNEKEEILAKIYFILKRKTRHNDVRVRLEKMGWMRWSSRTAIPKFSPRYNKFEEESNVFGPDVLIDLSVEELTKLYEDCIRDVDTAWDEYEKNIKKFWEENR